MITETPDENLVVIRVRRGSTMAMNNNYKPAARPSKVHLTKYVAGNEWFSPWGDDNLWPKTVLDALKACAPAQVAIEILVAMFYGNGPVVKQEDDKGNVTEVFDQRQKDFFRQSYLYKYLPEAATDWFSMGNQWAQLIRNKDKKDPGWGMVANITAPHCRSGQFNNEKGRIENVFIHGSWDQMPTQEKAKKVPLLNVYDIDDILDSNLKADRFMWRSGRYTPGNVFYDEAPFHALVKNGTMDVFSEIPKIRKRRVKDAMFIKYHIRIHELYWYLKCGGIETGKTKWEAKTSKERQKMREEFYTEIDNQLSGSINAFKSFFTPTWTDKNGNELKLIQIEKIDVEVGESAAFGPDMMGATSEVVLSFGLPSAVVNTVLSDNKSRGGGSDIQEGNNSIVARMPVIRHQILEPVEFAMRNTKIEGVPLLASNQWIDMDNLLLTRLDKNKDGAESTKDKTPAPESTKP